MTPVPRGGGGRLVDLHSHLVPAVDDGARNVEDVVEGVGRMWERGVATIVTTPHINASLTLEGDALERRLGQVDRAFQEAKVRLAEAYPGLTFLRGHEVMMDCPDPDFSDGRLHLARSGFVLVEWPRLQIPPETPRALRLLRRRQGVQLLIAHAERYQGYGREMSVIEQWREEAVFLQVNHGSLAGRYGGEVRERAFRMLERGWVDCLASDFHGRPHLRSYIRAAERVFRELGAEEVWGLLTSSNPARILRGQAPLPVPAIKEDRGVWRRLVGLFR